MSTCSDTVCCQPVGARPRFPEENPLGGGNFMRVPLLPTEKGGTGEADEDERIAFPQEPIEDDFVPRIPENPSVRPPYLVEIPSFPPVGSGFALLVALRPVFPPDDGGRGGRDAAPHLSPLLAARRPLFPPDDGGIGGQDRAPRFEPDENPVGSLMPAFPNAHELLSRTRGPHFPRKLVYGCDFPGLSQCPEYPGGAGMLDLAPLFDPDTMGGGGNDAPVLAGPYAPGGGALGGDGLLPEITMCLLMWMDSDGSKGGKRYPATLRGLAEIPTFPEERDGKGGKRHARPGVDRSPVFSTRPWFLDDNTEPIGQRVHERAALRGGPAKGVCS